MLDDIDHLLDDAIALHEAKRFFSASAKYLKILKQDALHADTNHNFGLLKVELGLKEEALIFLQTAINTNPDVLQYWVTFINTLTNVERFDDARAVLEQAHLFGHKDETLNHLKHNLDLAQRNYEALIKPELFNVSKSVNADTNSRSPVKVEQNTSISSQENSHTQYSDTHQTNILDTMKLDQALKLAKKKASEEAKKIYQDILVKFPKNKRALDGLKGQSGKAPSSSKISQDPAENQIQHLVKLYNQGKLTEVFEQTITLTKQYPNSCMLWNLLGTTAAQVGKLDEAIDAFKKAISIKPDYALAYYNMGNVLKNQGKLEEAIEAYKKAISIEPDNADAYYNMGNALKEQGKLEEAEEAYTKVLSIKPDYESAKHLLSALTGSTPKTAPREYVENLFDQFASNFEALLVNELEYETPKLIKDVLIKSSSHKSLGSILDLGCGTGLFGLEIKDHCSKLEGIDLSNKMLSVANQKNVYDTLSQSDIVEYLSSMPLDFDYYVALDVFIYVGDLSEIFRLIKSRSRKAGKFVFSTEHSEVDGYHILKTGRYTHSKSYIESLCKKFGYKISHFSTNDLRKEKGNFLPGGIYILEFENKIKHQSNILDTMKLDQALKLARKKTNEGLREEGEKIYQDILVKFPKNKRALDGLKGHSGKAASSSKISQDPAENQIQHLVKLYNQGNLGEVFEQTSTLTKQYPNSLVLWNLLGISAAQTGKLDKAIDAFKKAISIKPDYADAYNNLGNALKNQGKLDEAIEAYNKVLSIKPDNDTYYNMGNALKEQGKLDEAVEAYNKAISIKPDYAEAYNNMGIALQDQGKLAEAIAAYNKTLEIDPEYAEACYNMGLTLQKQGKLDEAIVPYKKALKIKPNYADAYYNMGNVLHKQGKPDEAIEAYTKALSIQPNNADAYYNMGIALREQSKLDEAIEAYKKAISIKPDYAEAWNNLYYPLQAIKLQKKYRENLTALNPEDINSKANRIELSILDYKLHRGLKNESVYLEKVMKNIACADNLTIQNPKFNKNFSEKMPPLPDKLAALVHFGRSGTGLMHSLIDGHPEVSTLPSIYFSEYFDHSTWTRIISDGWDGMISNFIAIYEVLFDATSSVAIPSKSKKLIHSIGINDGMANVGAQKNEVLRINKKIFVSELERLLAFYNSIDAFVFFKLVHAAYDKALSDCNPKELIFYHIHNPDTYAQLNFARFNPNTKWVVMVREPIQSCESWIRKRFAENDHFGVASQIVTMLSEIDNPVYNRKFSVGVRLEDLKEYPHKTIPALCKWMGIVESDSLYKMTAQGKKWWGDPTSTDYSKDGMEPFGKTSINRKIGSIFSENDQFVLRTLFYPFSVRFKYTEENEKQFKADLQNIRPMIDELFDFEKKIAQEMQISCEKLKGSGSYLYLRSGLTERWNTLNTFHTYPNMIELLKI